MLSTVKVFIFWKVNDTTFVKFLTWNKGVATFTVDKNLTKTNVSHICGVLTLSKVNAFKLSKS
jgi:hypothetical protein